MCRGCRNEEMAGLAACKRQSRHCVDYQHHNRIDNGVVFLYFSIYRVTTSERVRQPLADRSVVSKPVFAGQAALQSISQSVNQSPAGGALARTGQKSVLRPLELSRELGKHRFARVPVPPTASVGDIACGKGGRRARRRVTREQSSHNLRENRGGMGKGVKKNTVTNAVERWYLNFHRRNLRTRRGAYLTARVTIDGPTRTVAPPTKTRPTLNTVPKRLINPSSPR